jgi:hydrogenase/urease accessory protein HupE
MKGDAPAGLPIRRASWWGTAVFVATSVAAVAAPDAPFEVPAFVVAIALFFAGCGAFVAAYTRAVARSRTDLIGVSELFFLTGQTAPPAVKRSLLGALAVEIVVGLGSAIARPYTSLAAGTLVPVYGLGLCGVWASRHGTFPRRPKGSGRRRR